MSREWKSGDVGVNLLFGYRGIFVERCNSHGRQGCWHNESGFADQGNDVRRPLVVIDPEDREQVERLIRRFCHHTPGGDAEFVLRLGGVNSMQAALREFADPKPPKPEEPLGLGAVVLDADGQTWVRVGNPSSTWRRLDGKLVPYSDLAVVRVLSDGWVGEDR